MQGVNPPSGGQPPSSGGRRSDGPDKSKESKKEFRLPNKEEKKGKEEMVEQQGKQMKLDQKMASEEKGKVEKAGALDATQHMADIKSAVTDMLTQLAVAKHGETELISAKLSSDSKVPSEFVDAKMDVSFDKMEGIKIKFGGMTSENGDAAMKRLTDPANTKQLQELSNTFFNKYGYEKSTIEVAGSTITLPEPEGLQRRAVHPAMDSSRAGQQQLREGPEGQDTGRVEGEGPVGE